MQSPPKQRTISHHFGSTITFYEKDPAQFQTCDQSLQENRQHHSDHYIYPTIDESLFNGHSNKFIKKSQKKTQLSTSRYSERLKTQVSVVERKNYEVIQKVLKDQNGNLKRQNALLLREVYRLKSENKKCKGKYHQKKTQLGEIKEQCDAQRKRGDDIMSTIMSKLLALEEKFRNRRQDLSSCSLLQILNQTQNQQS